MEQKNKVNRRVFLGGAGRLAGAGILAIATHNAFVSDPSSYDNTQGKDKKNIWTGVNFIAGGTSMAVGVGVGAWARSRTSNLDIDYSSLAQGAIAIGFGQAINASFANKKETWKTPRNTAVNIPAKACYGFALGIGIRVMTQNPST